MIKNADGFTALVAQKTLTIREIFTFSQEVYPKMIKEIDTHGYEITGPIVFVSYGRDGDLKKSFEHEICIPIQSAENYKGAFEIKEYQGFKCISDTFTGTINQILRGGIPQLLKYAEEEQLILTNEMREVYHQWKKPRSKKNIVEIQFGLNK